jgi:hypothetical protein
VTPAEVADVLETSGRAYVNILRSVPPDAASWRPAPNEWCANECLGHIIEAEKRGFAGRIRLILDTDNPRLVAWDQPAVARERLDCEKRPEEMIREFEPLRRDSLVMLRALREDQLAREGAHPEVGALTVNDLIHEWVHHDGNHLRQMVANIQAYVWPKMGNAQRFSSG